MPSSWMALVDGMLALHLVVMADWPRNPDLDGDAHLPRDGVADLPGDLVGVLDGPLLALPLRAGLALGSAGLTVAGLCLPLAVAGVGNVSSISSMVDLRVATNQLQLVSHQLTHCHLLNSQSDTFGKSRQFEC